MKLKSLVFIISAWIFSGCSVGPEPIAYGTDGCAYCEMTIMDTRYGTEMVTSKGKVYKFDSVECLVRYLKENEPENLNTDRVLLTPFNHPETLEDAHHCRILYSPNMPSPMGMFLTAFKDEETSGKFRDKNGGTLYTWKELFEKFESLK
jgi:copper chaperone NosL